MSEIKRKKPSSKANIATIGYKVPMIVKEEIDHYVNNYGYDLAHLLREYTEKTILPLFRAEAKLEDGLESSSPK